MSFILDVLARAFATVAIVTLAALLLVALWQRPAAPSNPVAPILTRSAFA